MTETCFRFDETLYLSNLKMTSTSKGSLHKLVISELRVT